MLGPVAKEFAYKCFKSHSSAHQAPWVLQKEALLFFKPDVWGVCLSGASMKSWGAWCSICIQIIRQGEASGFEFLLHHGSL